MTLLTARGLTSGYHGVAAIHDIDLDVRAGEVVVLIGANGAGKSTTLLAIAGEAQMMGGEVRFDGAAFTGALHRRARRGMGFVTEERSIFRQLTVHENVRLGRGDPSEVYRLAPELEALRDRKAGLLSGGEQQILTLARALAARPRLLLADEVSLGLAPMITTRLLRYLRDAADEGIAVLLVEQRASNALEVADRAYVIRRGRVVASGSAAEVMSRPDIVEAAYSLDSADGLGARSDNGQRSSVNADDRSAAGPDARRVRSFTAATDGSSS